MGEIFERSRVVDAIGEVLALIGPLGVAVSIGVVIGWVWKPNFPTLVEYFSKSSSKHSWPNPIINFNSFKLQLPTFMSLSDDERHSDDPSLQASLSTSECRENTEHLTVDDLEHLCRIVEEKDGGPAWFQVMDRSAANMTYQAWRRDPETGPPQYRSRTVYEDVTPELARDFFWDDEFRLKWDDMVIEAETLEECPTTGTMVVRWVRKFPFFCSDREYVIGRRIWESGRSYYCVTKGVSNSVPRHKKPRRVDLYYSSWCIRAVKSARGDDQLTSCEVLLFHHEDMGIPWEIAKLGVRQGMWGAVTKIDRGLRAYQKERGSGAPLSRCAFMAQINTKVSADYLRYLEGTRSSSDDETLDLAEKPSKRSIQKVLIIGGAVALACSLDRGLVTKAVIFGLARRFVKIGRRL